MVDDFAKSKEVPPGEQPRPLGEALPEGRESYGSDPDSVLKLLDARLKIDEAGASGMLDPSRRSEVALEMTPTPMILDDSAVASRLGRNEAGVGHHPFERMTPTPPEPLSVRRVREMRGNATSEDRSLQPVGLCAGRRESENRESDNPPVSYHPPRQPPASIAPPAPAASISVANEYDPRAPTKPKVRRASTLPPAPQLLGLDRMLMWGMVLGGLFVAAIFVLVHKLAPPTTSAPRAAPNLTVGEPALPGTASTLAPSIQQPPGTTTPKVGFDDSAAPNRLRRQVNTERSHATASSSSAGRSTLPAPTAKPTATRPATSARPPSPAVTDKVLWIE